MRGPPCLYKVSPRAKRALPSGAGRARCVAADPSRFSIVRASVSGAQRHRRHVAATPRATFASAGRSAPPLHHVARRRAAARLAPLARHASGSALLIMPAMERSMADPIQPAPPARGALSLRSRAPRAGGRSVAVAPIVAPSTPRALCGHRFAVQFLCPLLDPRRPPPVMRVAIARCARGARAQAATRPPGGGPRRGVGGERPSPPFSCLRAPAA